MIRLSFMGALMIALIFGSCASFETVGTGHEAVATRFGKVTGTVLQEGFHVVNPLNAFDHFNTLQRTAFFEQILVPAADQQKADMDVSVQYRIAPGASLGLRRDTGIEGQVLTVHFNPIVRGALREAGRSTEKVEMFYDDVMIEKYRTVALETIQAELGPIGIEVTDVIVRDVELPQVIKTAIEAKKKREQEVEQERAELNRIALEAQQQVKQSEANLAASKLDAEAVVVRAKADAQAIQLKTRQLSPQYVEYVKATQWNGKLPHFTGGGAVPFINVDSK